MTTDFPALTDDLQEVYNEAASSAIAESVGMQIFDVKMTNRRTYDYLVLHSLDVIKTVAQGADLPVASTDEGESVALNKFLLIIGKTYGFGKSMATRGKLILARLLQPQRTSGETLFLGRIGKRCSGLYGNIKSVAEMTTPVLIG